MADFDYKALAPGELVFALRSERPIDLARFTRFLNSLNRIELAPGVPPLRADLVSLWPGSQWGKIRYKPPRKPLTPYQFEAIHARAESLQEQAHAIGSPADRELIATLDRVVDELAALRADQASAAADQKNERWWGRASAIAGTLGVLVAVAALIQSPEPTRQGNATGAMMDKDKVGQVELYCRDAKLVIPCSSVPAYQQRIAERDLYRVDFHEQRVAMAPFRLANPDDLTAPKALIDSAAAAELNTPSGRSDFRYGRVRLINGIWILDDRFSLKERRPLVIVNGTEKALTDGETYQMRGRYVTGPDGNGVFLVTELARAVLKKS